MKKSLSNETLFFRARDWIRTSTSFRTPPPEDGASTNFATRAGKEYRIEQGTDEYRSSFELLLFLTGQI